ncbi:hypothetical protein NPIL_52401 [Nephila pilipes]|uniref:Uncharacterized protein n=1 Tax=Nephila pilipes TaxID=299642 RepID=A0A8X6PG38_NEPPI|nr:hypothetical protein NPIL_52401 [Nephila pilipes]
MASGIRWNVLVCGASCPHPQFHRQLHIAVITLFAETIKQCVMLIASVNRFWIQVRVPLDGSGAGFMVPCPVPIVCLRLQHNNIHPAQPCGAVIAILSLI